MIYKVNFKSRVTTVNMKGMFGKSIVYSIDYIEFNVVHSN